MPRTPTEPHSGDRHVGADGQHRANAPTFSPIVAQTRTTHRSVGPTAYDCVRIVVVRGGSAILLGEFGIRHVKVGDVVLLAPSTLCGSEPEDWYTATTLYLDRDFLVDQVFWQYATAFVDRLDAQRFVESEFPEAAQVLTLGEARVGLLKPWLDELAALSAKGRRRSGSTGRRRCCSRSSMSSPRIWSSPTALLRVDDPPPVRPSARPPVPRHRQFVPVRDEARRAADMLRGPLDERWTLVQLAQLVHLSPSQLGRVFVEAFGTSPIAYLTMLRIEQMAHLLRTTSQPVTTITHQVGWHDPDFASRQFRRVVGIPPSRYRRRATYR